jgi:hypothetical protein
MKVTGKGSLSSFVKVILEIVFILGIGVILTLPLDLKWYLNNFDVRQDVYYPMLVILYISGALALIVVYKFTKLFKALRDNQPFIFENAKILKQISICCLLISVVYIGGIFVFQSVFPAIIFMIFVIAWIGTYILSELFKQAVEYKEENDLTI